MMGEFWRGSPSADQLRLGYSVRGRSEYMLTQQGIKYKVLIDNWIEDKLTFSSTVHVHVKRSKQ